jgi:hypothetical protein
VLAQARPGEQHPFRAKPGTIPFLSLFDLAARSSGGAVLWANADLFAEMVNLIKPAPAEFRPATFGHEGQVYDGWETVGRGTGRQNPVDDDRRPQPGQRRHPQIVRGRVRAALVPCPTVDVSRRWDRPIPGAK